MHADNIFCGWHGTAMLCMATSWCEMLHLYEWRALHGDVVRDNIFGVIWSLINFNSILRLNEASFMYKNLHVSANWNMKEINFDLRNMVSLRITRNGSEVHIDYRRTAVGHKAVSVSGAKLWNSIPMNIRNSNTNHRYVHKSYMYHGTTS